MFMIKNEAQYEYTKKKMYEFEQALKRVRKKYADDKDKVALLSQGYVQQIVDFKAQIAQYKKMKKTPLPRTLPAHDSTEISRQLTRLRLRRKLTQTQLASRIGCKQADISRLEREDYAGYTVESLCKVAKAMSTDLVLNFIPGGKK